jgi:membrane protease YdiL (CAAX protease family)
MKRNIIPPAVPSGESMAKDTQSVALLKLLIARHPYIASAFFFVYWCALVLALGRLLTPVGKAMAGQPLAMLLYETLGELLLAFIVAFPLLFLVWWPEAGFTRGITWRGIVICIFPLILLAGPSVLSLLLGIGQPSTIVIALATLLTLLVGFVEEGMFRGLLVRCLLPKGIWPTVLISSVLFAGMHLFNLLGGASWSYVTGQVLQAFGAGMILAALRLRTGSIWPGIILHASRDIVGMLLLGMGKNVMTTNIGPAALIVDGVFCALFVINTVILLRPGQKRKLAVAYGLAQPPATLPGAQPWPYASYPSVQGYPPYQPWPAPPPLAPLPPPPSYPPLANQEHPGAVSYQEYTSPAAYGEQPPAADPPAAPLPDRNE